ncbi:zinc-binding dehydrogenase [Georgenia sp. Z1344]|uniref:zinc-binding dehydrogenase n=1 Tax=Georgenia sp. Z1344 TaxID=3416706 RepID=UPI003CF424C3
MLAYEHQADGAMALVERPVPVAAEGEVTIDVAATGVCGTDLKIARGEHRMYPAGTVRVPGHEVVGHVRENRSEDPRLAPGTLVALAPNVGCGTCHACTAGRSNLCTDYAGVGLTFDGGFAEVVRVPARGVAAGNVLPVADGLEALDVVMTEPVAAVVRGLRPLDPGPGDTVLVCGAGPIGLTALLLARMRGVDQVIVSQTSAPRRELAARLGADHTINPRAEDLTDRVLELTNGRGADCVVVATPVAAVFADALRAAALGGRVNFFAGLPSGKGEIPLDANLVHYRELMVTGSTANTPEDNAEALAIVSSDPQRFRRLVTDRVPLADAPAGFARAAAGETLKLVLEP